MLWLFDSRLQQNYSVNKCLCNVLGKCLTTPDIDLKQSSNDKIPEGESFEIMFNKSIYQYYNNTIRTKMSNR